jgi:drug/metabolite transporter (DMT)-like permease
VKYGLQVLKPLTFTAIRLSSALLILSAVALLARNIPRPSRSDVGALLALGVVGNGFYQYSFVTGLSQTPVAVTALILASSPAWIAIISRVLGRDRQTSRGWSGIMLQLVGVTTVVLSTYALDTAGSALSGALFIIAGSMLWSLYSVLLQPYTKRVHPLHLSAITLASGSLFIVAVALPDLVRIDFATVRLSAWGAIAYSSIGAMIVAYLLYYRGIKVLGPTRTAMYSNLQPVVAIAVAWLTLHEAPSAWQWVGTALIMGGLLLARTASVASKPADTASAPALTRDELLSPSAREARPV